MTEPVLVVSQLKQMFLKGTFPQTHTSAVYLASGQLSPGKHPLVSQRPMLMKSQQHLLPHFVHWQERSIQVMVQIPHLRELMSLFSWRRYPFLCLWCTKLSCAADSAPPQGKVKRRTAGLWRPGSRIKHAVGSPRTDWYL